MNKWVILLTIQGVVTPQAFSSEIKGSELSLNSAEQQSVFRAFDYYEEATAHEYEGKKPEADLCFKKSAFIFGNLPLGSSTEYYRRDLYTRGYTLGNLKINWKSKDKLEERLWQKLMTPQYNFWKESTTFGELTNEFNQSKTTQNNKITKLLDMNKDQEIKNNRNSLYMLGNLYQKRFEETKDISPEEAIKAKENAILCFEKAVVHGNFRAHIKLFQLNRGDFFSTSIFPNETKNILRTLLPLMDVNNSLIQQNPNFFIPAHRMYAKISEKFPSSVKLKGVFMQYAENLGNSKIQYKKSIFPLNEIDKKMWIRYAALNDYFPALEELYRLCGETITFNNIEVVLQTLPKKSKTTKDDCEFFTRKILPTIVNYTQGVQLFVHLKNNNIALVENYIKRLDSLPEKDVFPREIVEYIHTQTKEEGPRLLGQLDSIYYDFGKFEEYINFATTVLEPMYPFMYLTMLSGISNAYTSLAQSTKNPVHSLELRTKGVRLMNLFIETFNNKNTEEVLQEKGSEKEKQDSSIVNLASKNTPLDKVIKKLCNCIVANLALAKEPLRMENNEPFEILYYMELAYQKGSLKALANLANYHLFSTLEINEATQSDESSGKTALYKAKIYLDNFIDRLKPKLKINPDYYLTHPHLKAAIVNVLLGYSRYPNKKLLDSVKIDFTKILCSPIITQEIKDAIKPLVFAKDKLQISEFSPPSPPLVSDTAGQEEIPDFMSAAEITAQQKELHKFYTQEKQKKVNQNAEELYPIVDESEEEIE